MTTITGNKCKYEVSNYQKLIFLNITVANKYVKMVLMIILLFKKLIQ